jgi:hypothetical protein
LDDLQDDLDANYPNLDIQLLGVNGFGHENAVEFATEGRDIPFLQDVDENGNSLSDAWELWDIEWRDVVILDADNHPVAVYNLTNNDLADPFKYDELKNLLLSAADTSVNESSISGYVYFDTNHDGIRDEAELAISQVEISLTGTDQQGQPVAMTTRTGSDGQYSFAGLPAGDYLITQKQPTLTIDGLDTLGSEGGTVSNDRFELTLGEGVAAEDYNFGERGRAARSVSLTDFFSSTRRSNALFVADDDGHLEWYCMQGEWSEYEQSRVEADATSVVVTLQDGDDVWQGSYDRDDNHRYVQLARLSEKEMARVAGMLTLMQSSSEAEGEEDGSNDDYPFHPAAVDDLFSSDVTW